MLLIVVSISARETDESDAAVRELIAAEPDADDRARLLRLAKSNGYMLLPVGRRELVRRVGVDFNCIMDAMKFDNAELCN